jgi:WD40 repeat protein
VKLGESKGNSYGLAISPDGSCFASADGDGTVTLYDVRARRLSASWVGFSSLLGSVAFAPDGTRLAASLGQSSAVRLWDLRTQRELLTLRAPEAGGDRVQFSPDGSRLLVAGYGGHCYVWIVPTLAELDAEYARQKAAR